jgi:phosphate starvation-inducible PhoH-like protein
MINGHVDKIILSRPAVEAGERLGFLPGDMKEKVDPYMQPLYDALNDFLPGKQWPS